jgi:16S rRNA (guanine527-N7)-methyltransferase
MTRRVIDDPQLLAFMTLFEKWNQSINLSAARTRGELEQHVVDCLQVVPHLATAASVLDVGSGGGLPVVIAAISLPGVSFTALEPVHTKHAFLRTAARELRLPNLEAFAVRIEDHDRRDYDAACSRATFDLGEWLSLGLTYVRPGGFVIGFEAVERTDLPMPIERHPYELEDKTRAIVIARRADS